MLPSKRKTKKFRKRLIIYLLFLFFLVASASSYYFIRHITRPLFISPLSKDQSVGHLDLEKKLEDNNIQFFSVTYKTNYYSIIYKDGGEIKLSFQKNIDDQISSLQRILRELTIEGRTFKSIDFRFDKPVVGF